jgi:hypothetical protein
VTRSSVVGLGFLAAITPGLSLAATSGDPLAGKWRADLAASRFTPDFPALRSQTMTCTIYSSGGIACTMWRVKADGQRSSGHFAARYDGHRYPLTGLPEMDGVTLRRDRHGTMAMFSKGETPVYAYRLVVSADRRRLTVRSVDPQTHRALFSIVEYVRISP